MKTKKPKTKAQVRRDRKAVRELLKASNTPKPHIKEAPPPSNEHYTIDWRTGASLKFVSEDAAAWYSLRHPEVIHVERPSDLTAMLLTANVVRLYKLLGGDILEFATRKDAGEALFSLVRKQATESNVVIPQEEVMAAKTAKRNTKGLVRRVSPHVGKKLVKVAKENPRREKTHGHKSWEAYKSGTLYEKAVEQGARPQDIAWDIKHGHVKVSK